MERFIVINKIYSRFFFDFLILFIFFGNCSLIAQDTRIGIKFGLAIPQLSGGDNSEYSQGFKSRFASNLGIIFFKPVSENFDIQIELMYTGQGGQKTGFQIIPNSYMKAKGFIVPDSFKLYANFNNQAILNYYEIPLLLKYRLFVENKRNAYIIAGPYIGILANARAVTNGTSLIYSDRKGTVLKLPDNTILPATNVGADISIKGDINPYNFGFSGGLGFNFPLMQSDLAIDLRAEYGLTNIQRDTRFGKNNTGCLVLTFGYLIPI